MIDKKIDLTKISHPKLSGEKVSEKYGQEILRFYSKAFLPLRRSLFDINSEGRILTLQSSTEIKGFIDSNSLFNRYNEGVFFQSECSTNGKLTCFLSNRFIGALSSFHQGGKFELQDLEMSSKAQVTEKLIVNLLETSNQDFINSFYDQYHLNNKFLKHQLFWETDFLTFKLNSTQTFHYLFEFNLTLDSVQVDFVTVISTCHQLQQ